MIQRFLLLTLLLTTSLFASYDNKVIEAIDIQFARDAGIHPSQITMKMKTREGDFFSQNTFDQDLKMLNLDYDRVEPHVRVVNDRLYITLNVYPQWTIRAIHFQGNRHLKTKDLRGELEIEKKSKFDRTAFNLAFHKLKAYYVKNGYFEAELEYRVEQIPETGEVDIIICIQEGRAGKIKEICFNNFTKSEERELLNTMCTKKYNFILSWFNGQGTYNEDMIAQDRFMVLNFLQNEGFADAQVEIRVEEAKKANRINIVIDAQKGPRYYFGPITFEGNTLFTDDQIASRLVAKEGCPYSPDVINETVKSLMNLYGKWGYIEAYVNYIPRLDPSGETFSVHFTIEEGEPFCVGLIKVFGNCVTQTKVILHETLLTPGETFNIEKLQTTEGRLRNIGYFKNVNVYAVKSEGPSPFPGNYRDVHIEVEEGSTGHLGAFFGLSSIEDLFGGVNVTEKNFNIAGFRNVFCDGYQALRGGGEYAHISASVGVKSLSYSLSWTKPYFMDTPWSLGVELERSTNRYISDDYTLKTSSAILSLGYQYNIFTRGGLHYRIRYSDDDVKYDKLTEEEKRNNPKLSDREARKADGIGLTSAVGGFWLYDSTDSPVKPCCGFRSRFEEEIAGVGGDVFYISFAYLNSWYYNLCKFGVLKLRCDLRFMQPYNGKGIGDIPLDERFFLGGDSTIRGYRPYRPGPKLDHHSDEPKGGLSMQFYSVEINRPLFSRLDGFIFCDAGYLSDQQWTINEPWFAAGFGARIEFMEGNPPIMIGMGFPINPRGSTDVKKFFFQMGGRF
jgi:outer membrane protein insertion porin family